MPTEFRTRVLVAEDEEFTLNLLREILIDANFEVVAVRSVSAAIETIETFDPHAVITDLNFGINAPSGADLLIFLHEERPWIGKVILTSHASPNLALPRGTELPPNVIYLVKSELQSIASLGTAINDSIAKINETVIKPVLDNSRIVVSETQGEILRLMAEGFVLWSRHDHKALVTACAGGRDRASRWSVPADWRCACHNPEEIATSVR